jgi:hypothetical protein
VDLVRTNVSEDSIAQLIFLRRVLHLLVTADVVPSSPILFTFLMEATRSSETSVLTRAKGHYIPEDGIFNRLKILLLQHLQRSTVTV